MEEYNQYLQLMFFVNSFHSVKNKENLGAAKQFMGSLALHCKGALLKCYVSGQSSRRSMFRVRGRSQPARRSAAVSRSVSSSSVAGRE